MEDSETAGKPVGTKAGTPDYHALARDLMGESSLIGRRMTNMVRNAVRGEMAVMHVLNQADRALTPSELADATRLTSARIANILRSLEEKGWVVRTHSSVDRRRVEVSLTDAGRAEGEARKARRDRALAEFLEALGPEDASDLIRIMRKSRTILESRFENQQEKGDDRA